MSKVQKRALQWRVFSRKCSQQTEARGLATGSSVSLRELRRLSQGACAFPWNRSPVPIPEPTPTPVPSSPHRRGYPHPRHTSFTSSSKRCPGFSFSSSGELPASRLYSRLCSAAQVLTTALRVCSSPRRLQFKEGLWLLNPQGQARYSDTSWGFNWCLLIPNVFVTQLCPPLSDPMDCSPPGSSVHGILQARVLEWVAIPFSRGSSPTQGSKPGLLHCRQILYC